MAELEGPEDDMVLCHFIVSDDVERSRRFYTEVLSGKVVFSGSVTNVNVALANSFIVINVGGGPTDDKPTVTLETPRDPDRTSSFAWAASGIQLPRALHSWYLAGKSSSIERSRELRAVPGQRRKGGGMTRVPVHKGIGNHSAPVAFWTGAAHSA